MTRLRSLTTAPSDILTSEIPSGVGISQLVTLLLHHPDRNYQRRLAMSVSPLDRQFGFPTPEPLRWATPSRTSGISSCPYSAASASGSNPRMMNAEQPRS